MGKCENGGEKKKKFFGPVLKGAKHAEHCSGMLADVGEHALIVSAGGQLEATTAADATAASEYRAGRML